LLNKGVSDVKVIPVLTQYYILEQIRNDKTLKHKLRDTFYFLTRLLILVGKTKLIKFAVDQILCQ